MNRVKKREISTDGTNRRDLESSTFLRRMIVFQGELQKRTYPNASTLASKCGCSRSTAMRTIDRLRYDFGVPLEYDESNRGYYLTDPRFQFASLPLGKSELVALVVAREIVRSLGDAQLQEALDAIWVASLNGRDDLLFEIRRIDNRFNASLSRARCHSSVGLTYVLSLCHRGQVVSMLCEPPLGGEGCRELVGRFESVSLRDGALFGNFRDAKSHELSIDLSSIHSLREIDSITRGVQSDSRVEVDPGELAHARLVGEPIEIRIRPPGSRFFARQRWHVAQEDSWDGDVLVRRLPDESTLETAQRVLSLGRFVMSVKPDWVFEQIRADIDNLCRLMGD